MSLNPMWTEDGTASHESRRTLKPGPAPKLPLEPFAEAVRSAIDGCHAGQLSDACCRFIAKHLREAGYVKADPYVLSFLDQLAHGLRDFRNNLQEVIRKTDLLRLTDEKAGQILKIIEHAKERRV